MNDRIIHMMPQGSEEWEQVRKGKATASRFSDILTPAKLTLSKSSINYAAELVAERLGIESPAFLPTQWMEWGTEAEEYAFDEFAQSTGLNVQRVGFVELGPGLGCSPDGMVGEDAILEIKCPKPETLIKYHLAGGLPVEYRLQVQGELWVTGRNRAHFYAWHPQLNPLHVEVEAEPEVHAAFDSIIPDFLQAVVTMLDKVDSRPMPDGFQFAGVASELDWSE